jgi:hypothetical protein
MSIVFSKKMKAAFWRPSNFGIIFSIVGCSLGVNTLKITLIAGIILS